ncbi:MAG TPA: NAD-dependent epimerase/dehydratase family protein, partial [Longimicrobiaceae bacterium]|nr:NAD-dependent epimerase/dehydratase family protein [Longimicrobiaceae bacterium]
VEVRGAVRSPSASLPPGVRPSPVRDLADRAGLAAALAGADTIVHLAARVHVMRETDPDPLRAFREVNVEGTRVLLEEAARAGVRRFLFASSVKAMGEGSERVLTESTPAAPVDPYGISKLEAEELVRDFAALEGMHAPILRLPLVYGAGVGGNMLRLFRLVDRGVPLPLGGVRNRRSMVFVGNLVEAVRAALRAPAAPGEVFLVSDGEDLSTPGLIRCIAAALGRPARLVPVPPSLFRLGGRVGDGLARVVPFPVTSAAVERLLGSLAVDSTRLRTLCGFVPPFTVEAGLRSTAEWYRASARRAHDGP